MEHIRQAAVAGMFYPGNPSVLARDVESMLKKAKTPDLKGRVVGLISPHAGYTYSGQTAAHGYNLLVGRKFDAVVLIGPSHREYFDGISIYPGDAYRTPLGDVPIHGQVRDELVRASSEIGVSASGHHAEHCLEVQLPFLQKVLGEFNCVPIIMGDQRRELCLELAKALGTVGKKYVLLLVASSDLSHYHPSDAANALDRRVIEHIQAFHPMELMDELEHERVEACGGGPIVAMMLAAKSFGADRSVILHNCNSGDVTGERESVVGYLSAAIVQSS